MQNTFQTFSIKFIDIMIGIILGLGFQWWPNLTEPWMYMAFIFVYLDIIDYWIDYSPAMRRFPPHHELELMLDMGLMFSLFLLIYSTQLTLTYFLLTFVIFRIIDIFWLWRVQAEYKPKGTDGVFIGTYIKIDIVEVIGTLLLTMLAYSNLASALILLIIFILFRITMRIVASLTYKKIHFV